MASILQVSDHKIWSRRGNKEMINYTIANKSEMKRFLNHYAKATLTVLACILLQVALPSSVSAQADGEAIWKANCTACHKIDQDLVGPAMKGISERQSEEWLIKWIRNSQAVIKSGDQYAVDLYAKWNNVAMPAFDLTDEEIKAVLAFIKTEEGRIAATASAGGGAGGPAAGPSGHPTANYVLYFLAMVSLIALVLVIFNTVSTQLKLKGIRLFNWDGINGFLFIIFMIFATISIAHQFLKYGPMLLPESASEHGVWTDNMLWITIGITFVVFVITHILLFVYSFIYRRKEGAKAYFYPDNHKLEFFWTIVPAVVLTALVLYGAKIWGKITQSDVPEDINKIEVFAYQFGWKARYAGNDNVLGRHDFYQIDAENALGIDTADVAAQDDLYTSELVLPVNKPVLLKFRAKDVIHSAYIPHFRVQMNVVPGMPTQFMFTPTITTAEMRTKVDDPKFDYEMACNKICGAAHFNMRMKVTVLAEEDYNKWLATQKTYFKKPTTETAPTEVAQIIQ